MSTVGTITKLATGVAGKAVHAATHPVATVTAAAGQARRVAATVVGGTHDKPEQSARTERPEAEPPVTLTPDPTAAAEAAVAAEKARAAEEPVPAEPEAAVTDIRTPAGTTAAGPGYNPDTNETDLHQPDTEPLLDPSLTKKVKAEAETMRKASDPGGE